MGPGYRRPITSERPALLLSGALDPNAPPAQAEEVLAGFPNGVHVVVENGSHETLPAAEVQAVVLDFLGGADVAGRTISLPAPDFPSPAAILAPPAGAQ
jgi:hypothetical protein